MLTMAAMMRPGLYYYLLPKINQARSVMWEGRGSDGRRFMDCVHNRFVENDHKATMTRYFKNGSIIRVTGSDNYESLIGTNPLGIIFSEYSISHPNAWNYLRPILAENDGFAVFPYTPRGQNHGWELIENNRDNPDFSISLLTVNDTKNHDGSPIITPEVIEQERRSGMPEPLIQQEYFCDFTSAVLGAYFQDEMRAVVKEKRIREVEIDFHTPVHTSWDLGVDDRTVIILWQRKGHQYQALYVYENNRKGMAHYIDELGRIKQKLGFGKYGIHFAPHDINVMEFGVGKTRIAQAMDMGLRFHIVPKVLDKEGIQCVRYILPNCVFSAKHTNILVRALTEYHAEYDFERKIYASKAVHDWTSHFVKAVQYFAVGYMHNFDQPQLAKQREYGRLRA